MSGCCGTSALVGRLSNGKHANCSGTPKHQPLNRCYGLSESIGPGVAFGCEARAGLHINEDLFYPDVLDPQTGEPVPAGTVGELVLTSLAHEAVPLLRYRTSFAEVREMYLEYQARALTAPEHRTAMDEYLQMQAQRYQEQQP